METLDKSDISTNLLVKTMQQGHDIMFLKKRVEYLEKHIVKQFDRIEQIIKKLVDNSGISNKLPRGPGYINPYSAIGGTRKQRNNKHKMTRRRFRFISKKSSMIQK